MENNSAIGQYLKDVELHSMVSSEEEKELAKRKDKGDKRARAKLINSNLRLVISFAKYFQNQGCDLEELIQEGNIGLMEGVDRYDWQRGFKVSTYVSWWIKQKMDRYVSNHGKNVRTPVHVLTLASKIRKIIENYRYEFNSDPSIDELCKLFDCTEDMARAAYQSIMVGQEVSIDGTSDNSKNIGAKMKDDSYGPLENVINNEVYAIMRKALSELSERDEKIIRLRFGISEDPIDYNNFPINEKEMFALNSRIITNKEEIKLGINGLSHE